MLSLTNTHLSDENNVHPDFPGSWAKLGDPYNNFPGQKCLQEATRIFVALLYNFLFLNYSSFIPVFKFIYFNVSA